MSTEDVQRAKAVVSSVEFEVACAISALNDRLAASGAAFTSAQEKYLFARLDRYVTRMQGVAKAELGLKDHVRLAEKRLLWFPDAKLCAILRAAKRSGAPLKFDQLLERANELSAWTSVAEAVVVRWVSKHPTPGFRPIVMSGLMRTAQCLMVRDLLSITNVDSDCDFAVKGGGGEKALIASVCKDIEEGYNWWWTPDVRNCFGAIKPGHLGWLPIDRRLRRNVMFLPKCAKIVIRPHENAEQIVQYLRGKYPDLPVSGDTDAILRILTDHVVRQGLVQGSVISPLLARSVIARELRAALACHKTTRKAFVDDLSIGALTKGDCLAARGAVTKRFSSLPAGPIDLHDPRVIAAQSQRVQLLGYFLEPGNGHGEHYVHVKPGPKRFKKFKQGLRQRLEVAPPNSDPYEKAETYRRRWFCAQQAWTKVPFLSDRVCADATISYVSDFLEGIPMGGWSSPVSSTKT